jgi:PAS domain S-box-containing protein
MAPYRSSIRISLILWGGVVMLLTLAVFVAGIFGFALNPAIRDISHTRLDDEFSRQQTHIQSLVHKVEKTLDTGTSRLTQIAPDFDDMARTGQVFRPLIADVPEITSVLFVHESGRAYTLQRDAQGNWINRLSDPVSWAALETSDVPIAALQKPDYDVRASSWFRGAMALSDNKHTFWSTPYIFYTDGEPGITVAKHLRLHNENYVLALNVRLSSILRAISEIKIGSQGQAVLMFEPGLRVASQINAANGTRRWNIKALKDSARPEIIQGFQLWQQADMLRLPTENRPTDILDYTVDNVRWFGYFHPVQIGAEQPHWLGIFVPESDLLPTQAQSYLPSVLGLLTASLLLALILATWLGKIKFAAPFRQLVQESERLTRLDLQTPINVSSSWDEIKRIAAAQEAIRNQLLATYQCLQETHVMVEDKVRERTARLEEDSLTAQRTSHLLAEMADSLPCAIFRFERPFDSEEGRFTFISRNVQSVLGFSNDDIQTYPELRWTYILPEDEDKAREMLQMRAENVALVRIWLPEKGLRWVEARACYSLMPNGDHCWNGYWLDVTEGQQLQQQQTNQLLFQEALFDAHPNPIFVKDTNNRYVSCNRAYEKVFGVRRADLIGKTSLEVSHLSEEMRTLRHNEGIQVLAEQQPIRQEINIRHADGTLRQALYQITPFKLADGSPGGIIGITVDVTPLKAMQADLQKTTAAAEHTTRLEKDFIANISHEIRTPMNAILGMARLALQTRLDIRQKDYLGNIVQSGQHLLSIINDILDFSKIGAGKLTLEHSKFELDNVLETIKSLIAEKAAAKGLELVFDVAPDVPSCLMGDALRLGQVLINYAGNAVKFTEHGEINIRIELREDDGNNVLLYFSVRDTGIGIDAAEQSKLFQNFTQIAPASPRHYGGTGLGLAISRQLAKLMGGEVGVASEPGHGSTFWFTARLIRAGESQRLAVVPTRLARSRVLIVDDNASARHVACETLRSMQLEVGEASSGLAALEMCRQAEAEGRPFRIVILDWHMPDMDGPEVAHRLRTEFRNRCPDLLMLTIYGQSDNELYDDATGIDAEATLIKPVSTQTLSSTILRILENPHTIETTYTSGNGLAINAPNLRDIAGALILLVEDNELNQIVAREILQLAGFKVDVADNGAIAIDKIQNAIDDNRPHDLILMDVRMPVMDGLEATRQLRAKGYNIPIVALTASVMPGDRERYLQAGMNSYIVKPMEPALLWSALCEWIKPHKKQEDSGSGNPQHNIAPLPDIAHPADAHPTDLPGDIPGLDINIGLRNVLGRMPLYRSLLDKFCSGHTQDPARMLDALANLDWPLVTRQAHTLKSVAGNIGATDIQGTATELEIACKQEAREEAERLIKTLKQQFVPLIERIPALLTPHDTAAVIINPDRVCLIVSRLAWLLSENDAEALECLQSERGLLRHCLQARFGDLETAIGNFEFGAALNVLRRACAEQQIALDRAA